jgi:GntR family transcriptional regulator
MQIIIDFRSGQPIYVQITEQIRQKVANGELKVGDQLPTVRQLATDLRVNFNTVARAYRLLDEAGLISTQQGRGTYIWEAPSQEGLRRLRQQGLDSLTRRYLSEVGRLDYTPDEVSENFEQNIKSWRENGDPPETHPEER